MGRLDEKVAIITGAASGIGWAIAERFAKEGAVVIALDVSQDGLCELEKHIADNGAKIQGECIDITDGKELRECIQRIIDQHGKIDILINDAARFVLKGIDATKADWQESFSVNVFGAAICTKYVSGQMKEQHSGSIVNIASISGLIAQPSFLTYSVTKAAIIQMTKNLALDFGKYGVRVNCISPGTIITGASEKHASKLCMTFDEFKQLESSKTVLNKVGAPEDIASAVLFLASEEASFITGANLMVDGGYTIV